MVVATTTPSTRSTFPLVPVRRIPRVVVSDRSLRVRLLLILLLLVVLLLLAAVGALRRVRLLVPLGPADGAPREGEVRRPPPPSGGVGGGGGGGECALLPRPPLSTAAGGGSLFSRDR